MVACRRAVAVEAKVGTAAAAAVKVEPAVVLVVREAECASIRRARWNALLLSRSPNSRTVMLL